MNKFMLCLSFTLIGCAHVPQQENVVQFPYAAELMQKIQSTVTRAPASIELDAKEEKSSRRVYFSSLYHQYLTLGTYFNQHNELQSCPQFHHDKLETEAVTTPKVALYKPSNIDQEGRNYFPELAFEGKSSLLEYHQAMRGELEVLCEEGISDNFYKFDNLITHYADKKSFHNNPKAMEAVLKIPVFANFYLVKMASAHAASDFSHPDETKFIQMTQTHWFERYVTEARGLRSSFIKNKLVKR